MSNTDSVSTERGRIWEDNTALNGGVAELIEWVSDLTNGLSQLKSEIDIKNSSLVSLEEVKVSKEEIIRLERLQVRSLQSPD